MKHPFLASVFKGIVQQKKNILSSFAHFDVIANQSDTKYILKNISTAFLSTPWKSMRSKQHWLNPIDFNA